VQWGVLAIHYDEARQLKTINTVIQYRTGSTSPPRCPLITSS
jgi:hypothetical protein